MSSVCSLTVLDQPPAWRQRLLSEAFLQPPWHDLHPDRLAIERDLPPALLRLARTIDRVVDRLSLAELVASFKGRGSAAHRPDLMLKAVLFLLQHRSLHSPAAWFVECHDSRVVAWLLRGSRPSRARWYAFRKRCRDFIDAFNQQLLHLATAEGLLDIDWAIFDGTFAAADSSRHVLLNQDNLQRRLAQLEQAIASDQDASESRTASAAEQPSGPPQGACAAPLRVDSPAPAGCELPQPSASTARVAGQAVLARALDPSDGAAVAQGAEPVGPAEQVPAAGAPGLSACEGAIAAAKAPGWMAKTPRGRQRQYEHYQKAAKELDKRLLHNSKRRKEDRKPPEQVRISLGDPEATLGLDKEKVYRPLHNVQLVSDLKTDFYLGYGIFSGTQDAGTFKAMWKRVEYFTGKKVKRAITDAGYATGANLRQAEQEEVELIAPYQENDYSKKKKAEKGKKQIPKSEFKWDKDKAVYICPQGKEMKYVRTQTIVRGEVQEKHQQYRCAGEHCQSCVRQQECTRNPRAGRMVIRGEYEEEVLRHQARMSSEWAKALYKRRKEQIERRIADSKEHRGLRRLCMRGQEGAHTQVGFTVLASNIVTFDKLEQRASGKPPTAPPTAKPGGASTAGQQPSAVKASTLPTFLL